MKRSLRMDEVGRTCAFGGQTNIHRARGALDTTEEVLHSVDLAHVATLEDKYAVGVIRVLRDVILMKIMDNALELKLVKFMEHHLQLDSAREAWMQQHQPDQKLCVIETSGNFCVEGLRLVDNTRVALSSLNSTPQSLAGAVVHWYNLFFRGSDPLQIKHKI